MGIYDHSIIRLNTSAIGGKKKENISFGYIPTDTQLIETTAGNIPESRGSVVSTASGKWNISASGNL
jgi:hypothetical protein